MHCTLSTRVQASENVDEGFGISALLARRVLGVLGCEGVEEDPRGATNFFLGDGGRGGGGGDCGASKGSGGGCCVLVGGRRENGDCCCRVSFLVTRGQGKEGDEVGDGAGEMVLHIGQELVGIHPGVYVCM